MTRFVMLCLIALMTCAQFGTKLFAQAGQTVTPSPQRAPTIDTASFTCRINCDTQAMNCQNSCPSGLLAAANPGSQVNCTLGCSNQQLVANSGVKSGLLDFRCRVTERGLGTSGRALMSPEVGPARKNAAMTDAGASGAREFHMGFTAEGGQSPVSSAAGRGQTTGRSVQDWRGSRPTATTRRPWPGRVRRRPQ
jgi:hypothetical protein